VLVEVVSSKKVGQSLARGQKSVGALNILACQAA
jgi:hypothetical protein